MIEQSTLDKIKEVTVVEIAEKLGLNPTKKQGKIIYMGYKRFLALKYAQRIK